MSRFMGGGRVFNEKTERVCWEVSSWKREGQLEKIVESCITGKH